MLKNQEPSQQQSPNVTLTASRLRDDLEQLTERSENFHISELQRQLDREAEEHERWDGMA